jgi:hypothetical protein
LKRKAISRPDAPRCAAALPVPTRWIRLFTAMLLLHPSGRVVGQPAPPPLCRPAAPGTSAPATKKRWSPSPPYRPRRHGQRMEHHARRCEMAATAGIDPPTRSFNDHPSCCRRPRLCVPILRKTT